MRQSVTGTKKNAKVMAKRLRKMGDRVTIGKQKTKYGKSYVLYTYRKKK